MVGVLICRENSDHCKWSDSRIVVWAPPTSFGESCAESMSNDLSCCEPMAEGVLNTC